MKFIQLIPVLFFISFSAQARWSSTAGSVKDIYSHNGTIIIKTEILDGPCIAKGGFWWPTIDEDSQIMLSLALTSLTTGKKITVVFNDSAPECKFDNAVITHMRLFNS